MQKIRVIVASLALAFGLAMVPALSVAAQGAAGEAADEVCAGLKVGGGQCDDDGGEVSNLVEVIVNIISAIAGILAVIMIIMSGVKYITSGGDSSKVASAKSTLIYALVGLLVVVFAQVIVRFVISQAI